MAYDLADLFADYRSPGAPGAAVAILRRGELAHAEAFGLADLESGRRCGPETNFRLASVTKQLTAALALLLAEERLLALDAPVGELLPDLPAYARAATPAQLLTHTAGLADYEDLIPPAQTEQVRDADVPRLLPEDPAAGTMFAPGAGYHYSNTGYVLLALLAERAGGAPFPELLRRRIFAPLGMRGTLALVAGGPEVPERAYGHTWGGGAWARTDQSVTSATLGDGGVYSSALDMARWLAALDAGEAPWLAAVRAAFIPRADTDDGRRYGYGWFVSERAGRRLVAHDGTTVGFRTAVVRLPELGLSAVVLANRSHADPTELALKALGV